MGDFDYLSYKAFLRKERTRIGADWRRDIAKQEKETGQPRIAGITEVMCRDFELIEAVVAAGIPLFGFRLASLRGDYPPELLSQFYNKKFLDGYESGLGTLAKVCDVILYAGSCYSAGDTYKRYVQEPLSRERFINFTEAAKLHLTELSELAKYTEIPDVIESRVSSHMEVIEDFMQQVLQKSFYDWNEITTKVSLLEFDIATFRAYVYLSVVDDEVEKMLSDGLEGSLKNSFFNIIDKDGIQKIQGLIQVELEGKEVELGKFEEGRICALETYIEFAKQVDRYTGLMRALRYGLEQVLKPFGLA